MTEMRYVVIPDIHGRMDVLSALLRHCGAVDGSLKPQAFDFTLVQLGDLVDRGPHSRLCVEAMMALQASGLGCVQVLRGNHEDMLLGAPFKAATKMVWMQNGGSEMLREYGDDFEKLCEPGGEHYAWMERLPSYFEAQGLFFCHAGLCKDNVKKMDHERLRWDRPPYTKAHHKALVCGHTPTESRTIEHKDGIFRCDLGLGYGQEKQLEYLVLWVEAEQVRWEVKKV
jgi:serine/threonine protein phosphatase 1